MICSPWATTFASSRSKYSEGATIAEGIRAFNKEVSLNELQQLDDETIGLGTVAWSLCVQDLEGVVPHGGFEDDAEVQWDIKHVRLRTQMTRWVCYSILHEEP